MYSRHELVWLTPSGWQELALAADAQNGVDAGTLARWRDNDWPAVVRRREAGVAPDTVCIGLPLPPATDGARRRFGASVPASAVLRRQAPLALAVFSDSAPAHWRVALAALLADAARQPSPVRLSVFGSCAMQTLTREAYLTPASDLDLLLHPRTMAELHAGLALLLRHAAALPLDGEIVFPNDAAVSWKEWAGARDERVLIKTIEAVRLAPKADMLASLVAP